MSVDQPDGDCPVGDLLLFMVCVCSLRSDLCRPELIGFVLKSDGIVWCASTILHRTSPGSSYQMVPMLGALQPHMTFGVVMATIHAQIVLAGAISPSMAQRTR